VQQALFKGKEGKVISETSRKAYKSIDKLGAKQQAVLDVIERQGAIDNWRISELLGVPINEVTGRSRELFKAGVIEVAYKDKGHTGRTVKFWKAKTTIENYVPEIPQFKGTLNKLDQLKLGGL
jgi:predicted ArsR family transcriptional regulator